MQDKEVEALIKGEEKRQEKAIELIPSENYVSDDVLTALGSVFTNKYSEGYPGKRYYGVCEGCTNERAALAYEKNIRDLAKKAAEQSSCKALIENFKKELSGGGDVPLADAYELSIQKPRRRIPSEKVKARKREMFGDFVSFMRGRYPDIKNLAAVQPKHAEEYISYIRQNGRFQNTIVYSRGGKTLKRETTSTPSNKTVNDYQMACSEVFKLLSRDAGLIDNPFDMPKLKKESDTREAFSEEELKRIHENLDDFTRPLFTLAITTALREGDICLLEWSNINFTENVIRVRMHKTGRQVEIPFAEPLKNYLLELKANSNSAYVLPDHAKMYRKNPTGISYRVKQFLERIGIQTTRRAEGRERAVSVKDLHSCRHSFCYYAGLHGIPLSVVQSIVGHMSQEMTKHYSQHATLQDKRRSMSMLGNFTELGLLPERKENLLPAPEPERAELHRLADSLTVEQIKDILAHIQKEN